MLRTIVGSTLALMLPIALAAQTPQVPNPHASDTAQAMVAAHRPAHPIARRYRGSVEPMGPQHAAVTPATPASGATPATPASPAQGVGRATPATPATPPAPAVPASPSRKPASPGQSGAHRP